MNLRPGDRFESFEIVKKIGEGGFATVYEANSPDAEETVALKISREPVSSRDVALRALREVRVLGSLSNAHVVHIYDHGLSADDRWYIVLERLYGTELSSAHDLDHPMEAARAVQIVQQSAIGLAEAHREGIVHRDIKPENLWVQPDGTIKVLDFGLARAWGTDGTIGANATVGNMLVGTPHYAQPEQVQSGQLTPASDVYSLGMVLYELLTGHTPFHPAEPISVIREALFDEPMQWLVAHLKTEATPIGDHPQGKSLPVGLRKLIDRTLAKDPAVRPQTGSQLASQLGAWLPKLGVRETAKLELMLGGKTIKRLPVLPGVHTLGFGVRSGINLGAGEPGALAILEWAGAPRDAEFEPLVPARVRINGHALEHRVRLVAGTWLSFDHFGARLHYPNADAGPK